MMYRVLENRVIKICGEKEGEEVVEENKPGMRRASANAQGILAVAYRFAVNILPGITFPATIVSIGWHGPRGLWILVATGEFFLYDCQSKELVCRTFVIGKEERGMMGCVDGAMDTRHGYFYALREDGDVCAIGPVLPVPFALQGSHLGLIRAHIMTTDDIKWKGVLKGEQPELLPEGPLEMIPAPSEGLAVKPLRILSCGEYVVVVFGDGRLDLVRPIQGKLLLLDSLDVEERIEEALSDGDVIILFTPNDKTSLWIHNGEFTLDKHAKPEEKSSDAGCKLEVSVDDTVTTMDLVYHAEGLRNDMPNMQVPKELTGPVFPVTSPKAKYVSTQVQEDLVPFMCNLESGIVQLMAKAKQLLTFALFLKDQMQEKKLEVCKPPANSEAIKQVEERMQRIRERISRITGTRDANLLLSLQSFTERTKQMRSVKEKATLQDVTHMLENRLQLLSD